jgi:hypothetical protein
MFASTASMQQSLRAKQPETVYTIVRLSTKRPTTAAYNTPWAPREDIMLHTAVLAMGGDWQAVSNEVGRPIEVCINRWTALTIAKKAMLRNALQKSQQFQQQQQQQQQQQAASTISSSPASNVMLGGLKIQTDLAKLAAASSHPRGNDPRFIAPAPKLTSIPQSPVRRRLHLASTPVKQLSSEAQDQLTRQFGDDDDSNNNNKPPTAPRHTFTIPSSPMFTRGISGGDTTTGEPLLEDGMMTAPAFFASPHPSPLRTVKSYTPLAEEQGFEADIKALSLARTQSHPLTLSQPHLGSSNVVDIVSISTVLDNHSRLKPVRSQPLGLSPTSSPDRNHNNSSLPPWSPTQSTPTSPGGLETPVSITPLTQSTDSISRSALEEAMAESRFLRLQSPKVVKDL